MLKWIHWTRPSRSLVFLSPPPGQTTIRFGEVENDQVRHRKLLDGAQRLRGRVYLNDGAIGSGDLTSDGRHSQLADELGYHILIVDDDDRVLACMRYLVHRPDVTVNDLALSRSSIARSKTLGPIMKSAVAAQIEAARVEGLAYFELGAWALSDELRGGAEAIRMLLTAYALARRTGGAVGITTATTRHRSSAILRRMGGRPIIPTYFDPHFNCEMELLSFHSNAPNHQYASVIDEYSERMNEAVVIANEPAFHRSFSPAGLVLHPFGETVPAL